MKIFKKWFRRLRFLIPAIVAAALYFILPHFPRQTEWIFARGIFRGISVPLGGLVAVLPFSLTECAVLLAFPAFILFLVLMIFRLRKSRGRRFLIKSARLCGWILSCAALAYMLLHGANFYRIPAEQLLKLNTADCTPEELLIICKDLAVQASQEREALAEDEKGGMKLSKNINATLRGANNGYKALQDEYPVLWGGVWRAKPVQMSRLWSYTGITGMYFPLFAEANVNIHQPDCDIPSTAAHELAHTRGFAREDECNFFAFLSCIHNESADYRYSGYLLAYSYCADALYDYDPDLWRQAADFLSEAVLGDLAARSEYWKQFEGRVEEISTEINDTFIQSQGEEDGVLSYGRVVRLIVGYYREAK